MTAQVSIALLSAALFTGEVFGAIAIDERLSEAHSRLLDDRREAIPALRDPFGVPEAASIVLEESAFSRRANSWRGNVVATVFWVGEEPTEANPTPNHASAWDPNWKENFGGYDDPKRRNGYLPAAFRPQLNPFYVALPYNDIGSDFRHRPEVSEVIPWFWTDYRGEGISVCKGRWIAIHHEGRICYAQWEDVGPFETDHWQYVFGGEKPRENRNKDAGIDISPAVRDFLRLKSGERVQWRFVEDHRVPQGPWSLWNP